MLACNSCKHGSISYRVFNNSSLALTLSEMIVTGLSLFFRELVIVIVIVIVIVRLGSATIKSAIL